MNYRVEDITKEGILVEGERDVHWLKGLFPDKKSSESKFIAPLSYAIHLSRSDSLVFVSGRISLKVELSCSRCLERFILSLNPDFDISLSPAQFQNLPAEMELQKEDLDKEFYDGEVIDLEAIIQHQIIFAMPFYPLCRENCKGLCPHCGINKNQETCQCSDKEFVDPRLSGLKNFFKK
ncbi:MAG: DUF177 domain-containing protein [Thermodesulfobacteriota bacterium]|nr:MAG: DUF177 domain-containing protein [Thermodesulfobacteriota bacterium]